MTEEIGSLDRIPATEKKPEQKKSGSRMMVAIIIIVLVLAAGGYYYYTQMKPEKDQKANTTTAGNTPAATTQPAGQTSSQLDKDYSAIDSKMAEFDAAAGSADKGLSDTATDLNY